jgi:KUP system potassium uptake protein
VPVAVPIFAAFGLIDLTFLSSNLLKIFDGGWFPIAVAAVVFTMMGTWWHCRRLLAHRRARDAMDLRQFVAALDPERPARIPGTAIFLTSNLRRVPVRCSVR